MSKKTDYTARRTNDAWPDESEHIQPTTNENGGILNGVLVGVFIGGIIPACVIFLWVGYTCDTGCSGVETVVFSFSGLIFGGLIGGLVGGILGWARH